MAAQGASNFCDLTQLIVSAVPGATGTEFVATLSDGTASYLFDMNTGATTSLFIPPRLEINFNPALPATNANVPWTLSLSQSVTAHATVIGVLQQAS
jgi:hypothetical protein